MPGPKGRPPSAPLRLRGRRPALIYVVVLMILCGISLRLISALKPEDARARTQAMRHTISPALPAPLDRALGRRPCLGCTAARRWGKAQGSDRLRRRFQTAICKPVRRQSARLVQFRVTFACYAACSMDRQPPLFARPRGLSPRRMQLIVSAMAASGLLLSGCERRRSPSSRSASPKSRPRPECRPKSGPSPPKRWHRRPSPSCRLNLRRRPDLDASADDAYEPVRRRRWPRRAAADGR